MPNASANIAANHGVTSCHNNDSGTHCCNNDSGDCVLGNHLSGRLQPCVRWWQNVLQSLFRHPFIRVCRGKSTHVDAGGMPDATANISANHQGADHTGTNISANLDLRPWRLQHVRRVLNSMPSVWMLCDWPTFPCKRSQTSCRANQSGGQQLDPQRRR